MLRQIESQSKIVFGFGAFTQTYEIQNNITQRNGESKAESIFDKITLNGDTNDLLLIYIELYKNEIVKEKEIELVKEWLKIIDTIMNN